MLAPCRVRLSDSSDNQQASPAVHNSPPATTVAPSCLKVIEPSSLLIVRRAIHKCAITRSFARHRHRIGIEKYSGPSSPPRRARTLCDSSIRVIGAHAKTAHKPLPLPLGSVHSVPAECVAKRFAVTSLQRFARIGSAASDQRFPAASLPLVVARVLT